MPTLLDAEIWRAIREHVMSGGPGLDQHEVITHICDDPCKGCARYTLKKEPELERRLEEDYGASGAEERVEVIIEAARTYKRAH